MTYPRTVVPLASGGELVHHAGKACSADDESRPLVGGGDGARTWSKWSLVSSAGTPLAEAPSFLSDPSGEGEFAENYRKNDRGLVFESPTGKTIVIVEDRSPTFPRRAYLMLRNTGTHWSYRELKLKAAAPPQPTADGPNYEDSPNILDLTDTAVRYGRASDPQRLDLGRGE
ncbi:hypothetical protein [Luteolibacter sp. LG18]|uniref:hypothetical protein n=1 Tax=Luteolibacter sp. LG18 TaxID=2819286 RepID=UPI002B29E2B6|nr:hypothetical protein llg_05810 [Luteolibacter sp. LG18]